MRDGPKPARVTRPSRRPALTLLVDVRNSERKRRSSLRTCRSPLVISSTSTGRVSDGVRLPRCQAVHGAHSLPGPKQRGSCLRVQRLALRRQRCQGLCPTGWVQPLGRRNQNPAAQRCNDGSIYCNVRETRELAIK